jgi:hypothetical protein
MMTGRDSASARLRRASRGLPLLASLLAIGCADRPLQAPEGRVTARSTPDGVSLSENGTAVLQYHGRAAPGREPWRVHYVHPLHSIAGAVITEDAPADHVHQRGIYWAWRRILVDGTQVADGWVGKNLSLEVATPQVAMLPDGSARIDVRVHWIVPVDGRLTRIIEENSSIQAYPAAQGRRRIEIVVDLRALRPGVALAGTDDEKGYSGIALRFGQSEQIGIESDGRQLDATVAGMETGEFVVFRWRESRPPWPSRVTASCAIDGRPWTRWVLRQEPSMQNCAFPGAKPVALPTERPLSLTTTLLIE